MTTAAQRDAYLLLDEWKGAASSAWIDVMERVLADLTRSHARCAELDETLETLRWEIARGEHTRG